jgi:D-glycero-D-manno-heptose 1,7-bisphosphate phosphatase
VKLVLLDRDGVINEDREDYVKSLDELILIPEALEALALFKSHGFTCVIITNQSVVGRGIIALGSLEHIHDYLCDKIEKSGGKIEDIFFCTDHPNAATYRRKPNPGMLIEALAKYGASADNTAFVGDSISDLMAAKSAGCMPHLVMTGKGMQEMYKITDVIKPVIISKNLLQAAQKIIESRK